MTDIGRDNKLIEKSNEVGPLEEKFLEEPSPELANTIINQLKEIMNMPKGYYKAISKKNVQDRIEKYEKYLSENQ